MRNLGSHRGRLEGVLASAMLLLSATTIQAQIDYANFDIQKARDVSVAPNGTLWTIGPEAATNASIQRLVGSALVTQPGSAVRVAVEPSGSAWVVNAGGDVYHWEKAGRAAENWVRKDLKAMDVAVGANGAVWAIGSDHRVMRFANGAWTAISGGGDRIAVDPSGNPWVTNSGHEIWHWNGAAWDLVPGQAQDVAVAPDGTVLVVGLTPKPGGFQIYRQTANGWAEIPGAAGVAVAATNHTISLAQIADASSQVVAVNVPSVAKPTGATTNAPPVNTQPIAPIQLQGTGSIVVSGPATTSPAPQPATSISVNGLRQIFVRDQAYEARILKALNYGYYGNREFLDGQYPQAGSLPPLERGFAHLAMAAAEAYYATQPDVTPDVAISQLGSVTRAHDAMIANLAVLLVAKMTDRSRDAETVALREWVTTAYRQQKVAAAKAALDQYLLWKNDPCGYEKKPAGECKTMANLFTTRTPPQDMIALNAINGVLASNASAVASSATIGAVAVVGAGAAALTSAAIGVVVVPGTISTAGAMVGQVSTSLFAAFGGTGAGAGGGAGAIGAGGFAGVAAAPIAAAVLAVVVGTMEGFKVVEAARVEPMLRLKLGAAMSEPIVIENALSESQAINFFYIAFQNAAKNRFAIPAPNVDGEVRFYNQAGYVARFTLAYTLAGARKSLTTSALAVGREESFSIPAAATAVVASGEWFNGVSWKSLFTKNLSGPTYIGYTSYGTVFSPAVKDEYPEISNIQQSSEQLLSITHGGGYIAKIKVTYTRAGATVVALNRTAVSAGFKQTIFIPSDATNIYMEAFSETGWVGEPWKQIIKKTWPSAPSECIKIYGTTLAPRWNNECK